MNIENTVRKSIREEQEKNGQVPYGNKKRTTYEGVEIRGLTEDPQMP